MRRTVMGINWDSMGRSRKEAGAKFRHHRCPDAAASVADTLMLALLQTWIPKALPHLNVNLALPFALTDNAYCDPDIGVDCVYVDSQDAFWHTSADVLETIEGDTLHAFATISVAYLHYLASAGATEAIALAQQTVHNYERHFKKVSADSAVMLAVIGADKPAVLAAAFDHLDYVAEICDSAVWSAEFLMSRDEVEQHRETLAAIHSQVAALAENEKQALRKLAGCEPKAFDGYHLFDDIAQRFPKKKFIGTPAYDGIPLEQQSEIHSPVWDSALHAALFWADGKHTFADIVRRISIEYGSDRGLHLAKHFRFMAEHGLVEWQ